MNCLRQLRELYAYLLIWCFPLKPVELFIKFTKDLIEDFMYYSNNNLEFSFNQCLCELQEYLTLYGKKCSSFGLPDPVGYIDPNENEEIDYENEKRLANEFNDKLNPDRKIAVDSIKHTIYPYDQQSNQCTKKLFSSMVQV